MEEAEGDAGGTDPRLDATDDDLIEEGLGGLQRVKVARRGSGVGGGLGWVQPVAHIMHGFVLPTRVALEDWTMRNRR
ncbi:hypothetical protein EYF80_060034 [Liparis tanakae]|uniref:Uncharacterized protein n=1 Tax=Liparis tanakae TaxID=230148 RepID=A0A4Z2ELI1_9TELE|nr:hypothetical protein EYF80_060034 [Liparis tanakae]